MLLEAVVVAVDEDSHCEAVANDAEDRAYYSTPVEECIKETKKAECNCSQYFVQLKV